LKRKTPWAPSQPTGGFAKIAGGLNLKHGKDMLQNAGYPCQWRGAGGALIWLENCGQRTGGKKKGKRCGARCNDFKGKTTNLC